MSVLETAKEQIKLKGLLDKDSDYDGMIGEALIELMEVFTKQGHSGMSAVHTAILFNKLVRYGGFFSKEDEDEALKDFMKKEELI